MEGAKSVVELLHADFEVTWLAATPAFVAEHAALLERRKIETTPATADELAQLGTFQSNDACLAVATMKPNVFGGIEDGFALVLDDLRDPGNLGTIIRTADWYGIRTLVASEETADCYNPKTINATMGSFCRVNVFYTSLPDFLSRQELPIFGASMDGHDVHQVDFGTRGLIVIGNESNGISADTARWIKHKITIPRLGGAESLNAAIATGIVLDNVFRSKK